MFSFFLIPRLFNTMDDNQHDGELIGLHNPANGRSCHQHECCGRHVRIGYLIKFKRLLKFLSCMMTMVPALPGMQRVGKTMGWHHIAGLMTSQNNNA